MADTEQKITIKNREFTYNPQKLEHNTSTAKLDINIAKSNLLIFNKTAIANDIETTAWSEGKELDGNHLCKKVSSTSTWENATIGLSFKKKYWINILTNTEKNVEKNI